MTTRSNSQPENPGKWLLITIPFGIILDSMLLINPDCLYDTFSISQFFVPQVPIWHTQYIKSFVTLVPIWCTGYVKIFRDLVKFPAHWKQLLSATGIRRRFFDRLLISLNCDIKWISDYLNLMKLSSLKRPFTQCVHSLNEKAYGVQFLLETQF